jgi:hypothetical protein
MSKDEFIKLCQEMKLVSPLFYERVVIKFWSLVREFPFYNKLSVFEIISDYGKIMPEHYQIFLEEAKKIYGELLEENLEKINFI